MGYKVKLQQFEGPMDLLVYLIEHNKMSIYDIKVSEITTQYIEYIEEMKEANIEVAEDFMVLAAELIELKSAMLLPREAVVEGEEAIDDPRKNLVERILEYKQFKEMAAFLSDQAEITSHIHTKPQEDISQYTGEEEILLKGDMESFARAFEAFIVKKHRLEDIHRIYERIERQKVSLENKVNQIVSLLKKRTQMNFSEMIEEDKTPFNKVITFITILELLKQNEVEAEQPKLYGDITVRRKIQ